ncbi:hypothetical protein ACFQ0B_61625 [Nonomuraea thailandensis]
MRSSSGETAATSSNSSQAARSRATSRSASAAGSGSRSRSGTSYGTPKSVVDVPCTVATTRGSPGSNASPARSAITR